MVRLLNVMLALCLLCAFLIGCTDNSEAANGVDVDLRTLSTTMAEAEFRNITANSDDYVGKTISASGELFSVFIDSFDRYFRYIGITEGDDLCCPPEGFEIRLSGDHVVDDDYPAAGTIIEVTGVLSRAEEFDIRFLYLAVDDIIILSD